MEQRERSLVPIAVLLGVLAAMLFAVSPGREMLDWLGKPDNAAVAQAIGAIGQLLFAAALFVTTVVTIWLARRTANETGKAATATRDAVIEAQRQRLDGARPILVFEMTEHSGGSGPRPDAVAFHARNIGSGPALNLTITLRDPALPYHWKNFAQSPSLPAIVAAGDRLKYELGGQRNGRLPDGHSPCLGTLTMTYDDIYGRRFTSVAALNMIHPSYADFGPTTFTIIE